MKRWADSEASDKEETAKAAAAAPSQAKVVPKKSKWEGEDEEEGDPAVCVFRLRFTRGLINLTHY